MSSEKPILHYITHTESSRERLAWRVLGLDTCETARSRLDARRSPDPGTQPGTAGIATHFQLPACPLLRSGEY